MTDFLPSYVDVELWSLFVEGRKESKHPLTQAGQKLAIRKLMGLHNDGWDVNASLEDSTIKGYRGLFPVRRIGELEVSQKQPESFKERDARLAAERVAAFAPGVAARGSKTLFDLEVLNADIDQGHRRIV